MASKVPGALHHLLPQLFRQVDQTPAVLFDGLTLAVEVCRGRSVHARKSSALSLQIESLHQLSAYRQKGLAPGTPPASPAGPCAPDLP